MFAVAGIGGEAGAGTTPLDVPAFEEIGGTGVERPVPGVVVVAPLAAGLGVAADATAAGVDPVGRPDPLKPAGIVSCGVT